MYSKLEGTDKQEMILEILKVQPERYVPVMEIEEKFFRKLDPWGKQDPTALRNMISSALVYASGLNDRLPPPNKEGVPDRLAPQTVSYLADIAMIWQTQLIKMLDPVYDGESMTFL